MKTFIKKTLGLTLTSTLLATTQTAFSAGFQINEHSAASIGRANAGDSAIAEDASVIASNPALMTQLNQSTLTAVASHVDPDLTIKGAKNTQIGGNDLGDQNASADGIVPSVTIPSLYYVHPINEKLSLGIGAFTNFGLESQYTDNYIASEITDTASIHTININPSIAYQISDNFSLGFGINYLIASSELSTSLPNTLPAGYEAVQGQTLLGMEGDGTDIGWNAGFTWKANQNTMIGMSYRSGFEIKFDGEATSGVVAAYNADGTLVLDLPEMVNLSIAYQVNDQLQLSSGIDYTNWSTFESLEAKIEGVGKVHIKDENWTEVFRYSLGASYQLNPAIKLRAGLSYDESPVKAEYRSLSIPDSSRIWYSAGTNIVINNRFDLDLAYAYIDSEKVDISENFSNPALGMNNTFTGTSEGHASVLSVQLNTRF